MSPDESILSDLEYTVLGDVERERTGVDLPVLVAKAREWCKYARKRFKDVREIPEPQEVERVVRSLHERGYLQAFTWKGPSPLYRLTPRGKVALVLQFRARSYSRRRSRKPLPTMPEHVGPDFHDLDVDFLGLDTRVCNLLKAAGFSTVRSLVRTTAKELQQLRGLSKEGVESVDFDLWSIGLCLRPQKEVPPRTHFGTAVAGGAGQQHQEREAAVRHHWQAFRAACDDDGVDLMTLLPALGVAVRDLLLENSEMAGAWVATLNDELQAAGVRRVKDGRGIDRARSPRRSPPM